MIHWLSILRTKATTISEKRARRERSWAGRKEERRGREGRRSGRGRSSDVPVPQSVSQSVRPVDRLTYLIEPNRRLTVGQRARERRRLRRPRQEILGDAPSETSEAAGAPTTAPPPHAHDHRGRGRGSVSACVPGKRRRRARGEALSVSGGGREGMKRRQAVPRRQRGLVVRWLLRLRRHE